MPTNTFEDICTFCCEVRGGTDSNLFHDLNLATERRDYLLAETEHFVVMPCIGALADWYVLVVSKRHALSVGWLTDAERTDLRHVLSDVTRRLREHTGHHTMVFEHGSYDHRDKGGACYDHAHIHVIATDRTPSQFLEHVPDEVPLRATGDWIDHAHRTITAGKQSYLALSGPDGDLIGHASDAPSQFFRRCLATWMGAEDGEWDWLVYPQTERVAAMMKQRIFDAAPWPPTSRGDRNSATSARPMLAQVAEINQQLGGLLSGLLAGSLPESGVPVDTLESMLVLCDNMSALLDRHAEQSTRTAPPAEPAVVDSGAAEVDEIDTVRGAT